MKLLKKCISYFLTGVGFGSTSYLAILTFVYPKVAPTQIGFISVFIMSGLIGLLSMIFQTDLPFLIALIIHLAGSFILFILMMIISNFALNQATIGLFFLIYLIVWAVVILMQVKTVHKINKRIKKRNSNKS